LDDGIPFEPHHETEATMDRRRASPRATLLVMFALPALLLAGAPSLLSLSRADDDPDLPKGLPAIDKTTYLQARADAVYQLRGIADDPTGARRIEALNVMTSQVQEMGSFTTTAAWTPIGPHPIPNGQTTTTSTAVSGRVTAIAVHPADANIVYVGTAQGGVYRSLNGGTSWIPIFDGAATLAIGALTLAPSDPTILYVGTGEMNLSADSFFGVGLYRIEDADTAPILHGPFNPTPTTDVIGAGTFTGRSISRILVDPLDPATIFVATGSGIGGIGGDPFGLSPPVTALRGIYRSTDATSAGPSFAKLTVTSAGSISPDTTGNRIVTDIIYDPTDATGNTILAWIYSTGVAGEGGVYRTTNAKSTATFTQTLIHSNTTSNTRGSFAASRVAGTTTIVAGTQETPVAGCAGSFGAVRNSLDGGVTWSAKLPGGAGYCGGQCWYDSPIAIHPTNPLIILIGGAGNSGSCSRTYGRSSDGGATFSIGGVNDIGLHADAHAIVFAPSDPTIVYEGNDGGIYKSTDTGLTWTSLNTTGFSATQFMSIDVHPIDPYFSIGGTQDNGTNKYTPAATWTRVDYGDGGFAVIDQNAPDNTNVTMYHTYYNSRGTLVGYARVLNNGSPFENWTFLGNGGNNIGLTEYVNFYAPLVRGPGSPNTIYYGTDRLHRSVDNGTNNPTVSQAPISAGVPISAIAIAPQDDNVRLVALTNFNRATAVAVNSAIWGTVTGSSTLVDMTDPGMPLAKYIGRIAIDPTDANIAYVCFGGFGVPAGHHVWKTTNLLTGTPTWSPSGSGLPDVPVNAFVVDPIAHAQLFAGTDVGVFISNDAGATWLPYNTGLPVVAVFEMKLQNPSRTLRIATHGRGMWERTIENPLVAVADVVGSEVVDGRVRLTWHLEGAGQTLVSLHRRPVPGDWAKIATLTADGTGLFSYEDADVAPGRSFEYKLGIMENGREEFVGRVWVDVPVGNRVALEPIAPNPSSGDGFTVTFSLPSASPAMLEVVDVTGRQVATESVGSMGTGRHQVSFGRRGSLRPGIYWVRLQQAGRTASRKVVVAG
jgi:hypothetical protein